MYYNVQVLRAVAAILVVWAHLRELFPSIHDNPNVPSGLAGVDLFFVISGFIMVVSTHGRRETPLLFLWKRFARVAPLYYLFTALVFAITLIAPSVFNSSTSNVSDLAKSIAFIPFYKSPDRIYPTFYLGWTLNYEMFFYALFALGLVFSGAGRVIASTVAILVLCAIGYAAGDKALASAPFYTFTRPIMLDFVMGMMIGLASERLGRLAERLPQLFYVALGIGIVWFLTGIDGVTLSSSTPVIAPPTDTVIEFGLGSALIVMSAVALERSGRIVRNPTLLLVGNASFSLYLSHFFIVALVKVAAERLGLTQIERVPLAVVTTFVCILVSIYLYKWVEKPLHALVSGRPPLPARTAT